MGLIKVGNKEFEPIINILHNPNSSQTLTEACKRCIRIAGTVTNRTSLNSDEGITSKQKRTVNRKGQIIDWSRGKSEAELYWQKKAIARGL